MELTSLSPVELAKFEKIQNLEERARLTRMLPHRYMHKHYTWSRDFYESRDKVCLLTAANQIGKSTVQIRKVLEWATNQDLWPQLWPTKLPKMFWYLYPSKEVATVEWLTKWIPLMPPAEHPVYGWEVKITGGRIEWVKFKTGIVLVFKVYTQDVQHLQTGTVDYVACFTRGHLVSTPLGPVAIEELRVGDFVDTRNGPRRVKKVCSRRASVIQRKFSTGQILTGTEEHPIWTTNRGWVQFGHLRKDDLCALRLQADAVNVLTAQPGRKKKLLFPRRVFNLTVEDTPEYFVNGILVHNCDEELPLNLYDELNFRLSASNGYYSMVFTATLGQDFWRLAMEPTAQETLEGKERFPNAWKRRISMFECMHYEDGSESHWTEEKIAAVIARCGTHNEIQKRVYGRFVVSEGRKYSAFSGVDNVRSPIPLPKDYTLYAGVDSGSGGDNPDPSKNADPAAIIFLAVAPNRQTGYVYRAWRGDGVLTTSGDIILKYLELKGNDRVEMCWYDYADRDLHTIINRMGRGENFIRADKSHARGENTLNTLFRHRMLTIFNNSEGLQKLAQELSSLMVNPTRKAQDHLCDALRYGVACIPWDWESIHVEPKKTIDEPLVLTHGKRTRGNEHYAERSERTIEDEFEEANLLVEM